MSHAASLSSAIEPSAFLHAQPRSLDDLLELHTAHTYIVRAHGDGMTGAGIHDNDLLVVDRALLACSGEVVVAAVNGEPLIRRLDIVDGAYALLPANDRYPPILIAEGDELAIWGVVRWNLHRLAS
ncbi:LexA family protein [Pseudomonas citronellolis]|uniref:LexA family protein n=1 Tax=Pseudomonas citronellolis TaxID=53408 RepID=UPI0023E37AE8|nr:S24 family peptidase [Pseudomonas citronellolis]MDF3936192.1 S24 family peptidase [Pseudomonas citronellolis]